MPTWRSIAICMAICAPFSVLAASCGHRTSIAAEADDGQEDEDPEQRACGYGLPCDPGDLGGRSCESLGLAAGQIGCDPKTCYLVLTKCGGGATTAPNGATGTPTTTPGVFGAATGGTSGTVTDGGVGLFGAGFFGGDGGFFGGVTPAPTPNPTDSDGDGGPDNGN